MSRRRRLLVASAAAAAMLMAAIATHLSGPGPAVCHSTDELPDPICTPGAIDPTITQATIHQTICVPGWLDANRPRPATSVTNRLKYEGLVAYGFATTIEDARQIADGFEEDHLISRELGGLSAAEIGPNGLPTNLWPEPGSSPNPKDAVERRLHDLVCRDQLPLAVAQQRIATNWKTALVDGMQP